MFWPDSSQILLLGGLPLKTLFLKGFLRVAGRTEELTLCQICPALAEQLLGWKAFSAKISTHLPAKGKVSAIIPNDVGCTQEVLDPLDSLDIRPEWLELSGPVLRNAARLSQRYPIAGFLVSQHGQLGAIPPPPFLSISRLKGMRSGGAVQPPPPEGVSQRYLREIPRKQGKTRANKPPLCENISKRYCAKRGGISQWAAKGSNGPVGGERDSSMLEVVTHSPVMAAVVEGLGLLHVLKSSIIP